MRAITYLVFLFVVVATAPMSAHVTIQPKTGTVNGSQEYVVRVPTEKDAATTSVRMVFPDGFEVLRFRAPAAGWHYEVERDASGRISGVTWSGGSIGREEYELFQFIARSRTPGVFKLDAYQTYGTNDVVGWVDAVEPRPAPKVTVQAANSGEQGPAAPADAFASPAAAAPQTAPATEPPSVVRPAMGDWMNGVALLVGFAALILSVRAGRRARSV